MAYILGLISTIIPTVPIVLASAIIIPGIEGEYNKNQFINHIQDKIDKIHNNKK